MTLSSFRRNDVVVAKLLNANATSITCSKDCKIYFPTRYVKANLSILDDQIYFFGLAMLVVGNIYKVIRTPALLRSSIEDLDVIMMDDTEMYELSFPAKTNLFERDIVQNGTLMYYSLNEFLIKGKIPAYVEYEDDFSVLYSKSLKFNGVNLFEDPIKMEILIMAIARQVKSPNENHRHKLNEAMRWIGLGDKNYGYPDNLARLGGGYLDNALTTALTSDPKEPTSLEKQVIQ